MANEHAQYNKKIKDKNEKKMYKMMQGGFMGGKNRNMGSRGMMMDDSDEEIEFEEKEKTFEEFVEDSLNDQNFYKINPVLKQMVSNPQILKIGHKVFNKVFERIAFYKNCQKQNVSIILGRDVLGVLVRDVYTNYVEKRAAE
jgi:hypothetical protein